MKRNAIESLEPLILMSVSAAEVDVDVDAAENNSAPEFFRWQQHVLVDENETFIQDVDAIDDDGDEVTFSVKQPRPLTGAQPRDIFKIDESTGVLEFVTPEDYERIGTRTLTAFVSISDGKETVERPVWVNLGDVAGQRFGQNTPEFIGLTDGQTVKLPGNSLDIDGIDKDGDSLSYSVVGGAQSEFFRLGFRFSSFFASTEPYRQEVSFLEFRENASSERPADGLYEVILRVSDGTLSNDVRLLIDPTDSADTADFPPAVRAPRLGETIDIFEGETVVTDFDFVDVDGDSVRPVFLQRDSEDNMHFFRPGGLGPGTAEFREVPDFEQPLDADGDNIYDLVATVGQTKVPFSVRVLDVDENSNVAPNFLNVADGDTLFVQEKTKFVVDLDTDDNDGNGQGLRHSIVDEDERAFSIDPRTGQLEFILRPDFEYNQDNSFDVTVRVSDGVSFQDVDLTVEVVDFNEAANKEPVFLNLAEGQEFSVTDGERIIFDADATDTDGQALTYSVTGTDSGFVRIDPATGLAFFTFNPATNQPLDANGDGRYELTVNVSDELSVASRNVVVEVADTQSSNQAPLFVNLSDDEVIDVVQNTTDVVVAGAADSEGDRLNYTIAGGADGSQFAINAATGELTFVSPPLFDATTDSDSDGRYEVALSVSDGLKSDTVAIVVNVLEEPDSEPEPPVDIPAVPPDTRPVFQSLTDGVAISVVEGNKFVSFVAGESPNESPVTYSMETTLDSWQFSLDETTGELAFFDTPDFEFPVDHNGDNDYELTLRVSDDEGSRTYDVIVRVEDAVALNRDLENKAPVFTNVYDGQRFLIPENERISLRIEAEDPEGDESRIFATQTDFFGVRVSAGEPFRVISTTGPAPSYEIKQRPPLDFETPVDDEKDNVYELNLIAEDEFRNFEEISLFFEVTDVDEGENGNFNRTPEFVNVTSGQVIDVSEGIQHAYNVDAVDLDDEPIVHSIVGGDDYWLFDIDPVLGDIRFKERPIFAHAADAGGDNVYDLVVRVDDGDAFRDVDFQIRVNESV